MRGPRCILRSGAQSLPLSELFQYRFQHHEEHKNSGMGKCELGVGFQFFNFFNHPNFGSPDKLSSDASFGQIFYMESPPTGILGAGLGGDASPRNIQLKVQLQF